MKAIETLIAAAGRVFGRDRDPALVHALAVETGLHVAGVALALDRSLELSPSAEELRLLRARAKPCERVLVVLAANVFVAPLRAIAWALACSPQVTVRPSRRATVFVDALLDAAPELGIARVPLGDVPEEDVTRALGEGTTLHVYGGQKTIDAIAARKLPAELHGPGFGAIVATSEELVAQADAIAEDVALFDQRGCLSPRVCFAIGDAGPAADALHGALARIGARVPRGKLDPVEASDIARARDVGILAGRALEGEDHLVIELEQPTIGPIGRVLPVISVPSAEAAVAWLSARRDLASLGTSLDMRASFPGVRVAALGAMQRPPLDGPVDLRVL
ncbi:MAG: acyl-CoA reductase [Polyangiales bacterium]